MKRNVVFLITLIFIFLINFSFSSEEVGFSCCGPNKNTKEEDEKKDIDLPSSKLQTLKSANFCRDKTHGFYFNISALLWQSKEGNLEYAAKDKRLENAVDNSKDKAEIIIPDFGWRPGVKVDCGYIFDYYDDWDSRAIWT